MEPIAHDRGDPEPVDVDIGQVVGQLRDHALFVLDLRGRAASWNRGVREVLGWDEADWIGQPARIAFTAEDVAAGVHERELQIAARDGRADDDRWMRRRDGSRFFASGSTSRLVDDAGRLIGFVKLLRDATALKTAQEQARRLLDAERAARDDAERQTAALTAAIEAIPDAVYLGDASGITRCNDAALQILGVRTLQELQQDIGELGRKFRVRRERDGPPLDPQELPFARALRGEPAVLETWATRLGTGEDVLIRGTAAPIVVDGRVVGAVAVNTDLTLHLQLQRQQLELAQARVDLRERDEQMRALTGGVRDYAIFTIDPGGRISSWHEGAERIKGYSAEEAIGMPFENLFTAEDRARGQPAREMALAARDGEYKGDGRRLRKDGSTFEAQVVLTALRGPQGQLLGYLKLTQDVSQRKQSEREREQTLRDAQAARAEAERASRSKGEFLATISHELRTPLSAILGWAQVLERGLSNAEGLRHGLAAISRNARVQVQLIEDLLDMNRIETGQLRLEMQPLELPGVIGAAIDSIAPAAAAKGVELRTDFDPTVGQVHGDPARLQQVVWNLLSNAVKFSADGGRVGVELAAAGACAQIRVVDHGQGIEPAFLERVFERFQQQDSTTTRRHGGLGLGLAIVRELVVLHGGQVRADSAGRGRGATFTVTLPVLGPAPVPLPAGADEARPLPPAATAPLRRLDGLRVLLVDDEVDVRTMAERVLRDAGAQVLAAASAAEALVLLHAHRPQAIVSDIGMPDQDGYDLLRRVRSLPPGDGGDTPAIAFTAFARPEDRLRAQAAGFQSHLAKPVEPAALVAAVAGLVGDPSAPR